MELKLETSVGNMTGVFVQDTISGDYTAWFKEKEHVTAQGKDITDAINHLYYILDVVLEFEKDEQDK